MVKVHPPAPADVAQMELERLHECIVPISPKRPEPYSGTPEVGGKYETTLAWPLA